MYVRHCIETNFSLENRKESEQHAHGIIVSEIYDEYTRRHASTDKYLINHKGTRVSLSAQSEFYVKMRWDTKKK